MKKDELAKLQTYLRKTFGAPSLEVRPQPKKDDMAEVFINGEFVAALYREDEDGEVVLPVPDGHSRPGPRRRLNAPMQRRYELPSPLPMPSAVAWGEGIDAPQAGVFMPLYDLDGKSVSTPGEGQFWVAPNAVVLGNVILERRRASGSARCCAATTSRSRSARARTCRTAACCTPTRAFRSPSAPTAPSATWSCCTAARIGRGSLIGIGSIILNGAKIGEECLIGANTLIAEGKDIPPALDGAGLAGQNRPAIERRGCESHPRSRGPLRRQLAALRRRSKAARSLNHDPSSQPIRTPKRVRAGHWESVRLGGKPGLGGRGDGRVRARVWFELIPSRSDRDWPARRRWPQGSLASVGSSETQTRGLM